MQRMVKIENLHSFLQREGLEVVRAEWGPHGAYPVLYTQRVFAPPLNPCAFCEHAQDVHEGDGACLALDCACEVYCPPLSLEGSDG
jgi:hypothetical protein